MKKKMIMIAALGLVITATSCSHRTGPIPSVVQNTLQASYPQAQDVGWEMEGKLYEAEFSQQGKEMEVLINDDGNVLMYKEDVAPQEVPATVASAVQTSLGGYQIHEAQKVTNRSAVYYQLDLGAKAKRNVRMVLTPDGQPVEGQGYWD